jgi:drug/metabolite transporter (DMT)-like permease
VTTWRWLVLAAGIVAISWAAPLVRLAEPAPVLVIAALRLGFAAPPMVAIASVRGTEDLRTARRADLGAMALAALALTGHFVFWIAALQRTSIITGVVLVTMQPIFVGIGAWIVLRERPSRPVVLGASIALVGALLLAGDDLGDRGSLVGDLLALIGGLLSSAYLVIGRGARRRISTASYGAGVYSMTALLLLVLAFATGTPLTGHSTGSYAAIVALAIVPQLIGHNAFNWSLGFLPAAVVAIAILGEPVGATAIAAIVLDEVPTLLELAGGAVVLLGVYVALRDVNATDRPEPHTPVTIAGAG